KIDFKVANLYGDEMYVDVVLHTVPKDKEKVPAYQNQMKIERNMFHVPDESKIGDCGWLSKKNLSDVCKKDFPQVTKVFQQGEIYKVEITVDLENTKLSRDLVVEDYLPSGFEIVQTQFQTESTALSEASKYSQWSWDYVEKRPEVIFAHDKNTTSNSVTYEYYIRPKFRGTFTQPPVSTYFMYAPDIQAYTQFNYVEVQ
ncbi:MAG: hypothetical protein GY828_04610, partial [Candidatus Gracilibacteria bacterium]|nr:hypothetical protein [Candidatus Gracilibacteria bacterium]